MAEYVKIYKEYSFYLKSVEEQLDILESILPIGTLVFYPKEKNRSFKVKSHTLSANDKRYYIILDTYDIIGTDTTIFPTDAQIDYISMRNEKISNLLK